MDSRRQDDFWNKDSYSHVVEGDSSTIFPASLARVVNSFLLFLSLYN